MILQALTRYYDILAADPDCPIARQGYSTANVSFTLLLSEEGELTGILPLSHNEMRGKKEVEVAYRRIIVPEQVKRAGIKPISNFLCDSSAYVLGISEKDEKDPTYASQRFQAFRALNLSLLEKCDCPEARSVIGFLKRHDPQRARENPLIAEKLDALLAGGNLVFMLVGSAGFVHEAPEIRKIWESRKAETDPSNLGQCLVTGEWTTIARLHPNLKGIRGAQAMGATLVGFNAPAYESYNRIKGQGWNAPTGEKAAFAYTTLLNYLLSRENENPKFTIGDATVVYWAESPNQAYNNLFSALFNPDWAETVESSPEMRQDPLATQRIREIGKKVKAGDPLDTQYLLADLNPETQFYVLGLAPNAARVAVRFFLRDPFQKMVDHIMAHYEDLQIERQFDWQPVRIPLYVILEETVSKKASDKTPSPLMAGAVMRSMLTGAPYPATLFYAILTRIRADVDDPKKQISKINYTRAAVIKAYLLRKYRNQPDSPVQEVLCMALNEQSSHPAYLLGRLFAVLENAQTDAIGDVNATIKDRYFTTACASPATVFPVLLRLAQHHIAKGEHGRSNDWRIEQILGMLKMDQNPIPKHLSLDEQGVFILGYYHQRAAFFQSKTAKENANQNSIDSVSNSK